jgi:hypothetical protein
LIALIDADRERQPEEIRLIEEYLEKLPASEEQLSALHTDLKSPMEFSEAFAKVTEPRHLSQLAYHARIFFWSDGDFSVQEEQLLNLVTEEARKATDIHQAMENVEAVTAKFHKRLAEEKAAEEAKKSSAQRFLTLCGFGNLTANRSAQPCPTRLFLRKVFSKVRGQC